MKYIGFCPIIKIMELHIIVCKIKDRGVAMGGWEDKRRPCSVFCSLMTRVDHDEWEHTVPVICRVKLSNPRNKTNWKRTKDGKFGRFPWGWG